MAATTAAAQARPGARERGGGSSGRQARRGRLLDPGIGLRRSPRARLREDRRRQWRQLQQLLRRLRRPEPRGGRGPARLGRPLLARPATWNGSSKKAKSSSKDWEKQPYGGYATNSVVVILVEKGNPLGHQILQGPGGKRRRRSDHPEPVQLRLGPLEHHGHLRLARSKKAIARPGAGSGQDGARKDHRPAGQRSRRASPPSPRARATCSSPTRTKRSRPKKKAKTSNTSSRRRRCRSKPRSPSPRKRRSRRPKTSSSASGRTKARKSGLKTATARSTRSWSTRNSSRPRTDLFKIAKFGGWGKVNDEFFDEEDRLRRQDRDTNSASPPPADRWRPTPQAVTSRTAPGRHPPARGRRGPRPRLRRPLSEPDRPAAAGGAGRQIAQRRASATSGTRSPRRRRSSSLEADPRLLADRGRDQRRLRHDHRLAPGPRRVPRQVDRQRDHRPALRAADDRRQPHPDRALRQQQPVRDRHRPDPRRRSSSPCSSSPCPSSSARCSRC